VIASLRLVEAATVNLGMGVASLVGEVAAATGEAEVSEYSEGTTGSETVAVDPVGEAISTASQVAMAIATIAEPTFG